MADQLDEELSWLDAVTHGRPYGVDVLIPTQLAGRDEGLSADEAAARVPAEHIESARDLLLRYGVIRNGDDFRLRPAAAVQYFAGQVVGMLNSVRPAAEVVYAMIESYIEAVARLNAISADD